MTLGYLRVGVEAVEQVALLRRVGRAVAVAEALSERQNLASPVKALDIASTSFIPPCSVFSIRWNC
jgi:hypothetical protein